MFRLLILVVVVSMIGFMLWGQIIALMNLWGALLLVLAVCLSCWIVKKWELAWWKVFPLSLAILMVLVAASWGVKILLYLILVILIGAAVAYLVWAWVQRGRKKAS